MKHLKPAHLPEPVAATTFLLEINEPVTMEVSSLERHEPVAVTAFSSEEDEPLTIKVSSLEGQEPVTMRTRPKFHREPAGARPDDPPFEYPLVMLPRCETSWADMKRAFWSGTLIETPPPPPQNNLKVTPIHCWRCGGPGHQR